MQLRWIRQDDVLLFSREKETADVQGDNEGVQDSWKEYDVRGHQHQDSATGVNKRSIPE